MTTYLMSVNVVLLTLWQWGEMEQFCMLLSNSMVILSHLWLLSPRDHLASCVILLSRTIRLSSGNYLRKKMADLIHHRTWSRLRRDLDWKSIWLRAATKCERSTEVTSFSSTRKSKWWTSMSWTKSSWTVAPPPTQSSSTYQYLIHLWQLQLVTESSFLLQQDPLLIISQPVAV